MDRAFDFARGGRATHLAVEIGSATEFGDIAARIFHNFLALDDEGIFQTHFTAGFQAEKFRRRALPAKSSRSMNSSRLNGICRLPVFKSSGLLNGIEFFGFAFGIIRDDDFDRTQHGESAQRTFVQIFADRMFVNGDVRLADIFCDADADGEITHRRCGDTTTTDAADGWQTRIVPAR